MNYRLIPPRAGPRRRRYFALLSLAKQAPPHQKAKLHLLARGLLERAPIQDRSGFGGCVESCVPQSDALERDCAVGAFEKLNS